jgi:hypothetical protein
VFALDRVKMLAANHPEWKTTQPFKAVLDGDIHAVLASGAAGLMQILAASHVGITTEEFEQIVTDWITSARHPGINRRYEEMIYQPMLDVMTTTDYPLPTKRPSHQTARGGAACRT